jgi:tetratricopeptide (TPR) repeat protein
MAAVRGLVVTNLRLAEYGPAESAMETLLSKYLAHPQIAPALNEIANAYLYHANDPLRARELYQRILADWPNSSDAMWAVRGLALTSIDLGDKKEAEKAVEDLLLNYSGHPKISFAVREAADRYFYYANEPSKACALYERILADWPSSPEAMEAQRGLAMAKVKMADTPAADAAADKLLSDYEGQPELAEKTAKVLYEYCRAGKTAEAIALSEKILSGNPDSAMALAAHAGLAQAYVHLGEGARVNKIVNRIVSDYRQEEQSGYSIFVIGEAYFVEAEQAFQVGNLTKAQEHYRKAESIWDINRKQIPEDSKHQALATHFTGWIYQKQGDYKIAIDLYQEVLDKWPSYEKIWQCALVACECYEKLACDGVLSRQEANTFIKKCYEKILKNPQSCPAPIKQQIRIWIEQYEKDAVIE